MPATYLISRTDSIGDVVLTLPVCGYLKEVDPACRIVFLCKRYTAPVVSCCVHVDEVLIWDDIDTLPKAEAIQRIKELHIDTVIHVFPNRKVATLCKQAGIKVRVGTSHRWWHWFTCNKLVNYSRRNSPLHEAQLNLKLIEYITKVSVYPLHDVAVHTGFSKIPALDAEWKNLLATDKVNVILHPKSQGNGREWPMEHYAQLTHLMPESRFRFFISGTDKEKVFIDALQKQCAGDVINIAGKMSLTQFIAFIAQADALVASGTGPLHIAAASGIYAIGIFPPIRPIHPGRWAPLGKHVQVMCSAEPCNDCKDGSACHCVQSIQASAIAAYLQSI